MSFRLLLDIIRARLFLVLLTLAITVGSAAALTYYEPERYVATTSMVFNFEQDSPFDSPVIPAQLSATYLATQLDIVRSQKVALKVVEKRGLANDPGWRDAYTASGESV